MDIIQAASNSAHVSPTGTHLLPVDHLDRLILHRVEPQAGVQMDDAQEDSADQSLPQAKGQHRVGHVDEHDAAGAAVEGFAAGGNRTREERLGY